MGRVRRGCVVRHVRLGRLTAVSSPSSPVLSSWLLRAAVMCGVHILARIVLGAAIMQFPLQSTVWKTLAVALVVLVALVWGGVDGLLDRRANPDPEDYEDLTVRWLKAGILAGAVAGVVSWVLGNTLFSAIGPNSLLIEIFAGGSFTALLIFGAAFTGAAVGRFLGRPTGDADEAPADGDDFADADTEEWTQSSTESPAGSSRAIAE